ncbi:hypothetical protein, partial [Salmonella enterica]|uniref:hypothetical protein n=1 Tax=Salmonella enterica TaxID=28901 RepID=UPI0035261690
MKTSSSHTSAEVSEQTVPPYRSVGSNPSRQNIDGTPYRSPDSARTSAEVAGFSLFLRQNDFETTLPLKLNDDVFDHLRLEHIQGRRVVAVFDMGLHLAQSEFHLM